MSSTLGIKGGEKNDDTCHFDHFYKPNDLNKKNDDKQCGSYKNVIFKIIMEKRTY